MDDIEVILQIMDDVEEDCLVTKVHAQNFAEEFSQSMSNHGYKIVKEGE